jgi:hypothetical protein
MNPFLLKLRRFIEKCNRDMEREASNRPRASGLPKLYNIEVNDLEGKHIKTVAWNVTLPEAYSLMSRFQKSRLILESQGNYTLHHTEIIEVE